GATQSNQILSVMRVVHMKKRGLPARRIKSSSLSTGGIADNAGYVDNLPSTPYRPRETMASTEGERYAASTAHPPTRGLPTAPSGALSQSPEPSMGRVLSRVSARSPVCGGDAGPCPPRPQRFRRAHARGPAGHPVSGPDAEHARRQCCLDCGCLTPRVSVYAPLDL